MTLLPHSLKLIKPDNRWMNLLQHSWKANTYDDREYYHDKDLIVKWKWVAAEVQTVFPQLWFLHADVILKELKMLPPHIRYTFHDLFSAWKKMQVPTSCDMSKKLKPSFRRILIFVISLFVQWVVQNSRIVALSLLLASIIPLNSEQDFPCKKNLQSSGAVAPVPTMRYLITDV